MTPVQRVSRGMYPFMSRVTAWAVTLWGVTRSGSVTWIASTFLLRCCKNRRCCREQTRSASRWSWGSWCTTQERAEQRRLTRCLLQHASPAVGRSVLQLRCRVEGHEVPVHRMFDSDSALKEHKLEKKGSLGRMEKATILRLSGRCYGLNSVPSEVLPPSASPRDCIWR